VTTIDPKHVDLLKRPAIAPKNRAPIGQQQLLGDRGADHFVQAGRGQAGGWSSRDCAVDVSKGDEGRTVFEARDQTG